jgi:Ca2+-binding RTX toxin-like protein
MKKFIRPKELRPTRQAVLAKTIRVRFTGVFAASLLILAAVLTSGAGAASDREAVVKLGQTSGRWDPVSAAGSAGRKRTMTLSQAHSFKRPKLRRGVLSVIGTDDGERIALRLKSAEPDFLQVDVGDDGSADFSFKRRKIARITVEARAGDDRVRIDEGNGVFTDSIQAAIHGGAGNDSLFGGSGAQTLIGDGGNDSIDGNAGNDLALMGAGDDTFVWDPGDGSDVVEGEAGADTMLFNGANIAERVDLSANGSRLRFFRDAGNITMDTNDVESVDFNALGGPDTITVNDLSSTDVTAVATDLAATGGLGDGQLDRVVVNGTNGDDMIDVSGDASRVAVDGLSARVAIRHQEPSDELAVNGLGGNDEISAAALAAQAITLTLDGGAGVDSLAGGRGSERLLGGEGNDSVDGNAGSDLALMGAGDDTFVWDPGDGSDVVEGEAGADTMLFNGANIAEQIDVSANGNRVRFFRDAGNITMDTAGVERIDFEALGGADLVAVNDLTGTDLTSLNVDLEGTPGAGDGQPDRVVVNGTDGDDAINVNGDAGGVKVSGLAATVGILHSEAANDRLEINTLEGSDAVDSNGLAPGAIQLLVDGTPVP